MRAVIQRVSSASVTIDRKLYSSIGSGLLILLGIKSGDGETEVKYLAEKCIGLRIFEDHEEKMNLSVKDVNGSILVVSQFTLYGDTRKGNRPSFVEAASPQIAEPLYEKFVSILQDSLGKEKVSTGVFRAMMDVALVNDGPVTVIVESK
ncbi:MAG: D-aminoacyl-tRNA deacylase [Bacteroidota bacterium]|nr:D-aminoacyl-tRNA deacylase [Bacteroidota bacterium]